MGLNISAKIGRNMEWSAAIPVADASYMIGKAPALYPTKYWRHVANTNEGTEMKITTINDTKWSMIVFFFIAATIPAASPIGMADLKYWYIGTHFHGCAPVSMEEYILQEIAVLLDYGLIKMIFFIQSINNGL